jgi:uncharacterized protein (DUF2141 family)
MSLSMSYETLRKILSAAGIATALITTLPQAWAADLTVTVKSLNATQGAVRVGLFNNADTFLAPNAQINGQMAQAAGDSVTVVFRDLPAGRYALSAFHDENGNGKLDRNVLGNPVEPFGFSNEAMGNMAAPSFEQAAIDFAADASIVITLK